MGNPNNSQPSTGDDEGGDEAEWENVIWAQRHGGYAQNGEGGRLLAISHTKEKEAGFT